jgi:hypothetical protein
MQTTHFPAPPKSIPAHLLPKTKMTKRDREFQVIYNEARIAGLEAGRTCGVVPMVVEQHANPANDASPVTQSWFVEGGVCGFAWIKIKPANSPFANWLKKNGHVRPGAAYDGGVNVWVKDFGQSMQRKEAFAYAFADVLNKAGIKAYAQSRMD